MREGLVDFDRVIQAGSNVVEAAFAVLDFDGCEIARFVAPGESLGERRMEIGSGIDVSIDIAKELDGYGLRREALRC